MAPIPIKQLCRNLERINSVRTWLQNLTKIEKSVISNHPRLTVDEKHLFLYTWRSDICANLPPFKAISDQPYLCFVGLIADGWLWLWWLGLWLWRKNTKVFGQLSISIKESWQINSHILCFNLDILRVLRQNRNSNSNIEVLPDLNWTRLTIMLLIR